MSVFAVVSQQFDYPDPESEFVSFNQNVCKLSRAPQCSFPSLGIVQQFDDLQCSPEALPRIEIGTVQPDRRQIRIEGKNGKIIAAFVAMFAQPQNVCNSRPHD